MGKMWNVFLQNHQNHNRQGPHVEKNKENKPLWVTHCWWVVFRNNQKAAYPLQPGANNPPQTKMVKILKPKAVWQSTVLKEQMINFIIKFKPKKSSEVQQN